MLSACVRNLLVKVTFYDSTSDADAETNETKVVEYTYDMMDRRIGKTVDDNGNGTVDSRERYVWDILDGKGNAVLDFTDADLDGTAEDHELSARYLWGQRVDELFAQEEVTDIATAGTTNWTLTDNLGTVRDLLTYNSGTGISAVDEHFTYEAFGRITSGDTSAIRYTYTAQEYDPDTGLFYYDKRWYRAETGRFLTPDPIEDDAENTYRYVGNSPTNFVDPHGMRGRSMFGRLLDLKGPVVTKMTPQKAIELGGKRFLQERDYLIRTYRDFMRRVGYLVDAVAKHTGGMEVSQGNEVDFLARVIQQDEELGYSLEAIDEIAAEYKVLQQQYNYLANRVIIATKKFATRGEASDKYWNGWQQIIENAPLKKPKGYYADLSKAVGGRVAMYESRAKMLDVTYKTGKVVETAGEYAGYATLVGGLGRQAFKNLVHHGRGHAAKFLAKEVIKIKVGMYAADKMGTFLSETVGIDPAVVRTGMALFSVITMSKTLCFEGDTPVLVPLDSVEPAMQDMITTTTENNAGESWLDSSVLLVGAGIGIAGIGTWLNDRSRRREWNSEESAPLTRPQRKWTAVDSVHSEFGED